MAEYQILLERIMCIFWLLTYIICIIISIKQKYVMISPITQIIFISYEISYIIMKLYYGSFHFNYIVNIYILWLVCEIIFTILFIKYKYRKMDIIIYFESLLFMTTISMYFIVYKLYIVSYGYLIAIIGELFWLFYLSRKDYPILKSNLIFLITKFLANLVLIPSYFDIMNVFARILCISLPILDAIFIIIYIKKLKVKTGE